MAEPQPKAEHEEGTLGAFLHEARLPGVPCPDHPDCTGTLVVNVERDPETGTYDYNEVPC